MSVSKGYVLLLTKEVRNELEEKGKQEGGEKGRKWIAISKSTEKHVPLSVITEICSTIFGSAKLREGSEWMTYVLGHSELVPPQRPVC